LRAIDFGSAPTRAPLKFHPSLTPKIARHIACRSSNGNGKIDRKEWRVAFAKGFIGRDVEMSDVKVDSEYPITVAKAKLPAADPSSVVA